MNAFFNLIIVMQLILLPKLAYGAEEINASSITDNLIKVCDKPENAGSYWDINVKGDGEASVKLKLAKLGLTGEAEFSKGEWEGIQRTVEDNKNYRDCVKTLTPVFLSKFIPLIQKPESKPEKMRVLGGVKWQESGQGVQVTLTGCSKQSSSVTCQFIATSLNSDVSMNLYSSSAIYDQNGNKYTVNSIAMANFKKTFKLGPSYGETLDGELIKGVDTKISVNFNEIDSGAVMVSKAMLNSTIKDARSNSESQTFSFHDIKILFN